MQAKKVLGLALLVLFAISGMAIAADPTMPGYSLSAGAYWPVSGNTRDDLGSTWWDVALGYRLPTKSGATSRSELAIGYIKGSGESFDDFDDDRDDFDTDAWMIPVTYTYRTIPSCPSRGFYYGAGGGIYFTSVDSVIDVNDELISDSDTSTKLGLTGLVGYQFTNTLSAEAGYTEVFGKTGGYDLSGISLKLRGEF